jgi:transcriptional regulator with XRE-family HTH domain
MAESNVKISDLGRFLAHQREARNWSRGKLIREAGVGDPSSIKNVETGRTQGLYSEIYEGVAKALGYPDTIAFGEAIEEWATANPQGATEPMASLSVPFSLAELIKARADEEEMNVPDLLATLLARRPGRKRGA